MSTIADVLKDAGYDITAPLSSDALNDIDAYISDAEKAYVDVKSENEKSKEKLDVALNNVHLLRVERFNLQTQLQSVQTEMQTLFEVERSDLQNQLQSAKTQLQDAKTQLQAEQIEVQTLLGVARAYHKDIENIKIERSSLQNQLETEKAEVQMLKSEAIKREKYVKEQEDLLVKEQEKNQGLTNDIDRIKYKNFDDRVILDQKIFNMDIKLKELQEQLKDSQPSRSWTLHPPRNDEERALMASQPPRPIIDVSSVFKSSYSPTDKQPKSPVQNMDQLKGIPRNPSLQPHKSSPINVDSSWINPMDNISTTTSSSTKDPVQVSNEQSVYDQLDNDIRAAAIKTVTSSVQSQQPSPTISTKNPSPADVTGKHWYDKFEDSNVLIQNQSVSNAKAITPEVITPNLQLFNYNSIAMLLNKVKELDKEKQFIHSIDTKAGLVAAMKHFGYDARLKLRY